MRVLSASALLGVSTFLVACGTMPPVETSDLVTVKQLISAVRKACNEAKAEIDASETLRKMPLTDVSVTVQTSLNGSLETGFDLIVVSAKGRLDQSATQSLTLKLKPTAVSYRPSLREQDIYTEVVAAIKAAAAAAIAAHDAAGSDFALEAITASVGFDVTETESGGMKLTVGSLTIGPAGSKAVTGSQRIDLTFLVAKKGPPAQSRPK